MFERFTDRARRVVVLTEAEAREIPHSNTDTGHLVLGLLKEGGSVAWQALADLGVTYDDARAAYLAARPAEVIMPPQGRHAPFTPRLKRAMELAVEESLKLGHNYLGAEHLLLGLVRLEDQDAGSSFIANLVPERGAVRTAVTNRLAGYARAEHARKVARLVMPPAEYELVKALAESLRDTIGGLDGYIESRAREMAAPLIRDAERRGNEIMATANDDLRQLRDMLRIRDRQADELVGLQGSLAALASAWQDQARSALDHGEAETLTACARMLNEAVTHAGQG